MPTPTGGSISNRMAGPAGYVYLTLVATEGKRANHSTSGTLRLWRTADDIAYIAYRDSVDADVEAHRKRGQTAFRPKLYRAPLYGATTIPVEDVGGLAPKDPALRTLPDPGVIMRTLLSGQIVEFTIGEPFGARHAFYTKLTAYDRSPDGTLVGRWTTILYGGLAESPDAGSGHFCAIRRSSDSLGARAP